MGRGWAKGVWVLLGVCGLPLRAGADFVHVLPSNASIHANDSIVPSSADGPSASPSDTVAHPQPISTASDSPSGAAAEPPDSQVILSPAPAGSNVPPAPQVQDSSSQGVHPVALNGTGAAPGVPEPSMLGIAFIASATLLGWRRRSAAHDAADRA